ncbi:MAG: hypothetical protein EON60_13950 [Alphaproteobacteria bacterium]|nr:MAG: hypothetical protein EON60_13950 [Alphaproteobacteria bacterium]
MADVYKVVREASDGARWEGVAELDGGRLVEKGAWVMANGTKTEGTVDMMWGTGDDDGVLKVVTAFGEHEYLLVESEDGWVGQYECGDDMYYVQTQNWGGNGWTMQFEVEGPKKDGWQKVHYERQQGQ